jgi:hypothetical protein
LSRASSHPAKYNPKFIGVFAELLNGCQTVLDPFGGTGRIRLLEQYGFETVNLEIEPEWATDILGDSTMMPFKDETFDAICTSPTYGNRMADTFTDHCPEKQYVRNTYRHRLGRKPSVNNTGGYQFGDRYLDLHRLVYGECMRVLKPGGKFVLNTKNFIHRDVETDVTGAHTSLLTGYGFQVTGQREVPTVGLKFGANRNRVQYETITLLTKGGQ